MNISTHPFNVVCTNEEAWRAEDDNLGICIECGEESYHCEPDAQEYVCEFCEQSKVYGFAELVLMGYVSIE